MAYLLGVVVIALAILISVCLHEAGHMFTAKWFGMRVTRFFAGFGPTVFSWKRGETEYGLKAIPAGGFVKIVGMTPNDDDAADQRAMWRFPVWKRTVVMAAGSAMHFVLGAGLLWITFSFVGVPNPNLDPARLPAMVQVENCVVPDETRITCQSGDAASPALAAGMRSGDVITSFDGTPVSSFNDLLKAIRAAQPGTSVFVTYQRDGQPYRTALTLGQALRSPLDHPDAKPVPVAAMGVSPKIPSSIPTTVTYGPLRGAGEATRATGQMFVGIGSAIKSYPSRIPALWDSLSGKPRDVNTPVSVVGVTELGGQSAANHAWYVLLLLAANVNLFVGVFNLLPLLPLDGGHIAIAWFEKLRSVVYRRLGRKDPGRVDYLKLMPITYAVILVFGSLTVLTLAADIVNPITLFGK